MKRLTVKLERSYDIIIENNILSKAGELIRCVCSAKKACLVSDSNVYPLYGKLIEKQLCESGFEVIPFIFPAGEGSKTPETVLRIVGTMAENDMMRGDIVIALGGGVCGDIAGFAASVYLRGIDFVQLPTSLLSQLDSSVGGKTGVNLKQGKNLCGAFHQPSLVLIDPCVLDTLSQEHFSEGIAEAIKAGCIRDKVLFELLEKGDAKENIEEIIFRAVRVKAEIVERDEKERGERALLNFGHTAGHAIERLHGFSDITHGEAVAAGMALITRASQARGLTLEGTSHRLENVLKKYKLPLSDSHTKAEIIRAMNSDKKRRKNALDFVLIKKIGEGYIYPVKYEDISAFFGC